VVHVFDAFWANAATLDSARIQIVISFFITHLVEIEYQTL
jgi:hypothetical protein